MKFKLFILSITFLIVSCGGGGGGRSGGSGDGGGEGGDSGGDGGGGDGDGGNGGGGGGNGSGGGGGGEGGGGQSISFLAEHMTVRSPSDIACHGSPCTGHGQELIAGEQG